MRRTRTFATVCLLITAANSIFSEQTPLTRFEFAQIHMGTRFRIVLYTPEATTATRASHAAFDRIRALDNTMSDYQASSELMRLCQQAGGPPVKVSEDLFRILATAEEISRHSDGAFDVTVGPLVRLWRMTRLSRKLPDPDRLARASELVGYWNVRLDPEAQTVQPIKQGMLLDLGGIAKGFAVDEALAVLKQHGISRALVAGGGDIAVSDSPPGKEGWTIGIASLESPEKAPGRYLLLRNAAVSTSGDAEQHVEIGGIRYSHIINPQTGQALTGRCSVTVVAPNCATSDALATAVSVLGPRRGLELIGSASGTSALITIETGQGIQTFEVKFPHQIAAE